MRIALIIVGLMAITLGLIHLRRAETAVRHEIQRLRSRRVSLRRELWEREVRTGRITAPVRVQRRVAEMAPRCGRPDRPGYTAAPPQRPGARTRGGPRLAAPEER